MHTKQMPDNLIFYFEPEACAAIKLPLRRTLVHFYLSSTYLASELLISNLLTQKLFVKKNIL